MPRIVLPPDAFDEIPDGWCHSAEPDDADRAEHEFPPEPDFPEYDDYADRVAAERQYDAEELFAELVGLNERSVA